MIKSLKKELSPEDPNIHGKKNFLKKLINLQNKDLKKFIEATDSKDYNDFKNKDGYKIRQSSGYDQIENEYLKTKYKDTKISSK